MSAIGTLTSRCRKLGIKLHVEHNGWYWTDTTGSYGPYQTKTQAALNVELRGGTAVSSPERPA